MSKPFKLMSVAEGDEALRDYVEAVSYVDEQGKPAYADGELPEVSDPELDEDSEET